MTNGNSLNWISGIELPLLNVAIIAGEPHISMHTLARRQDLGNWEARSEGSHGGQSRTMDITPKSSWASTDNEPAPSPSSFSQTPLDLTQYVLAASCQSPCFSSASCYQLTLLQ